MCPFGWCRRSTVGPFSSQALRDRPIYIGLWLLIIIHDHDWLMRWGSRDGSSDSAAIAGLATWTAAVK